MKSFTFSGNLLALLVILISSSCNGQQKSDKDKNTQEKTSADLAALQKSEVRDIFHDKNNNIWFATDGQGAFKYDGKKVINLKKGKGMCDNFIHSITQSENGTIWFKTRDSVCSYNPDPFSVTQISEPEQQLTAENIQTAELLEGNYILGNKAIHIELPRTSPLNNEKSPASAYDIYCSFKDSRGNFWYGTFSAGVCMFNGKTYTWLNEKELAAPVRCIYEDKNGIIWIGNNGYGLFSYDGATMKNFTKENKLENPEFLKSLNAGKEGTMARVWSVAEDQNGNLWIATIDAGAWMYDGKTLTNYTTKDGLGSNSISKIYKDKNGVLWLAAGNTGVYTLKGKAFEKFTGK